MNIYLFQTINSSAGQNYWFDRTVIFFAEWFGYFLILALFLPLLMVVLVSGKSKLLNWSGRFLLRMIDYRKMVILSLVSAVVARFGFVELIRYFYYNPRPFLVLQDVNQLISHETTSSFPSGHAAFYFALATGIYLYNKKAGIIYFIGALLIGLTRVIAGIHWPLDVLGGAGLGVLVLLLANFVKKKNLS